MKVHLEDNLYIEADSRQFVIRKYTGRFNKDGEELTTILGHFSTLKGLMYYLQRMKLKESAADNVSELIKAVEGLYEYTDKTFAKMKEGDLDVSK